MRGKALLFLLFTSYANETAASDQANLSGGRLLNREKDEDVSEWMQAPWMNSKMKVKKKKKKEDEDVSEWMQAPWMNSKAKHKRNKKKNKRNQKGHGKG